MIAAVYIQPVFNIMSDLCVNLTAAIIGTGIIVFNSATDEKEDSLKLFFNIACAIMLLIVAYIFQIL